jgi:replicative DNA helicase
MNADESPLIANLEAEQALLGAMMIDNRCADDVADILAADDFAEPLHGRIFAAAMTMLANGGKPSPVTLKPQFETDPAIIELGGVAYLAGLTAHSAGLIAAREMAQQILDLARLRRTIGALEESLTIARASLHNDTPLSDIAEAADAALNEALTGGDAELPGASIGRLFREALDDIEAERRGDLPPGLECACIPDLTDVIGGMRAGEVTVIAGRPGMGKTALGLSIALGVAEKGHGVAFISREMSRGELAKRMLADRIFDHGNCPTFDDVKAGKFTQDDYRKIAAAQAWADKAAFEVVDKGGAKIGQIIMALRRLKRRMAAKGQMLELAVIDYLQLVEPDKKTESRVQDVGYVSRKVKQAAKDLGIHIILLAQLSRAVEQREDKHPVLSDLRDSGEIEQDADNVVFVYREEYYLKLSEPGREKPGYEAWLTKLENSRNKMEIYSAKRRNGETARRHPWFFLANQAVRGSRYFEDRR